MKLSLTVLPSMLAILGGSTPALADIVWTGAVSNDMFDVANWDLTNSTVTTIAPNVPISDSVVIQNAPAPLEIPELPGQQRFEIDDGFSMLLDNSKIIALGNDGVGCFAGPATGVTILVTNGASFEPFFIVNSVSLTIDATSQAVFGGGGNPINLSTVDMNPGATFAFLLETPADFVAEHLSKTFVAGVPAMVGGNIDVVSDGAAGCIVTVLQQTLGSNYCPGVVNSSGTAGVMSAVGSSSAAANDVTLTADGLPPSQFGIFITSRTQGFVPMGGGTSNGNICLGGAIGRFNRAGEILPTGGAGTISLALDLTDIPQGNGTVTVLAGDTWNFQAWHRDGVGLGSNFTDGLEISFN